MADNITPNNAQQTLEGNLLYTSGPYTRNRPEEPDSRTSSISYSDDGTEGLSSDLNFTSSDSQLTDITSDDELDQEDKEYPTVVQRTTTFERVLSDAIIHHAPIEELKIILQAGTKLIDPVARRPNPLHCTVWQKYPEAAQLLIERGYDVNALDDFGYSALHLAARHGDPAMVELLLNNGSAANFNTPAEQGTFPVEAVDEPLRLALKYGHKASALLLLQHGASPHSRYFFGAEINLVNPLKTELLELLLIFGARVNEKDRHGLTPIMMACRSRQGMESLLLLLAYGGDVNIRADARHDNRTALHYAVLAGSTDLISVLLGSGSQLVFEETYNRPTPLHLAVRRGDTKVINALLDAGADINSSTSLIGSVLHMACTEKISNRLEVLQLLLSRGANPNISVAGLDGSPILPPLGDYLSASDDHDPEVINLLLRYGAEVIIQSQQNSPLGLLNCLSALSENPHLLEELLEGAQQFDLPLIRYTSLLGKQERKLCLQIAGSPLSLRHLSRVCLRHTAATARPEAILKLQLPSFISKYLLYEIS